MLNRYQKHHWVRTLLPLLLLCYSDLGFYFATNTDNRINYGPALENVVYVYARTHGYSVSIGRIGALECDFIFRRGDAAYACAQVAMTIMADKKLRIGNMRPSKKFATIIRSMS